MLTNCTVYTKNFKVNKKVGGCFHDYQQYMRYDIDNFGVSWFHKCRNLISKVVNKEL